MLPHKEDKPAKIKAALRVCERLGVLDRVIVPHPVYLDGEDIRKIFPPRLFYLTHLGVVAHSVGDEFFYASNPSYQPGGVSKEIYVLDTTPDCLGNYFAMEKVYSKIPQLRLVDRQRRVKA